MTERLPGVCKECGNTRAILTDQPKGVRGVCARCVEEERDELRERIGHLEEVRRYAALVELRWSNNGGSPDQHGGMTTSSGTLWARFGSGEWERVHAFRSQHKAIMKIRECLEIPPKSACEVVARGGRLVPTGELMGVDPDKGTS